MSETKHTKGPWGSTTRRGSWDYVVFKKDDPNIEICQMFHDGTDLNEIGEANARLVSAAPEMYEALNDIFKTLSTLAPCPEEVLDRLYKLAEETLDKAEGK